MKIMQINVWQGRLIRPLLALIRAESPDVIFAQEIYSYPVAIGMKSPWNYFSTLEVIQYDSPYTHAYFSPSNTFPVFGQRLSLGNAIISKLPFTTSSTHYTAGVGPIHVDQPTPFDHNLTRNFQHVTVGSGQSKLNLINHHGHWVNQPHGDNISIARLEVLSDYINALTGPTIVGGDFNLSPNSRAISIFEHSTGLRNLTTELGISSTLSEAHYISNTVCDYIMLSPELKVQNSRVLDQLVSDHKALIAAIDI